MAEIQEIKQRIVDIGKCILEKGLVHGKSGNISARIDDKILITPSAVPYPLITPESILILDLEGNILQGGNPSSEVKMHIGIYIARNDVNAVMHTHSVYASALAACRKNIPVFLDEMIPALGGPVLCSEYGMPGSQELADNVVKALGDRNGALIANHGVVACGPNLEKALHNVEFIERLAKMYILAKISGEISGEPAVLPEEVIELERNTFEALNR